MKTFKAASEDSLMPITLKIRYRDINNKVVYTTPTTGQSFINKWPTQVLVWSILLTNLATWLVVPLSAQRISTKVIVAMDTNVRSHVYDQSNANSERTNADEVISILTPLQGLRLIKKRTSPDWRDEERVRALNPDLIIIHLSAFAPETRTPESWGEEERKFISVLQSLADTKAQILMYSRRSTLDDEQGRRDWISSMERRVPELRGRIQVFTVDGRQPQGFRNQRVRIALQAQVKSMLGIR